MQESSMIQITKDTNGGQVEIALGEQLEIQLPENPTTGYRWHFQNSGSPVLEVHDDSYQVAGAARGAGGMRRWRLQSVQEGCTQLAIAHRRSWETNATETFVVEVQVTAK